MNGLPRQQTADASAVMSQLVISFQQQLEDGDTPSVLEFLDDDAASLNTELAERLLGAEVIHQQRIGRLARREDFLERYEPLSDLVQRVFDQWESGQLGSRLLSAATIAPEAAETAVQSTNSSPVAVTSSKETVNEPIAVPSTPISETVTPETPHSEPLEEPLAVATQLSQPAVGVSTAPVIANTKHDAQETLAEAVPDPMQTAAEKPTATPSRTRISQTASGVRIIPKVLGDYELLDELGKGGMGIVYRAKQRRANRVVALKIIRPDRLGSLSASSQAGIIERFRKEAQAAARLHHDNLVTVYEVGEIDGCHYFSMQYVEGSSLADRLRKGPLDNKEAARFLEPICRAVHAAHQVGVLHRDIKPQNILIENETLRPRIADFGLAKLADDEAELTQSGEMMGTPPYMPPEQFGDAANCTAKADIYSLGASLYHSLSGRPPFQAATSIATMRQVLEQDAVSLRTLNAAVDVDLETLCMRCLEKEPERRIGSAEELADELQRYINGEPILSRPLSRTQKLVRWCRRNPVVAVLIGAVAASLLLAVGALAFTAVKTEQARQDVAKSLGETKVAQALSEVSFQDALSAVNEFFTRVSEERLLNEPGTQGLRKELLDLARTYYLRLLDRRGTDDSVQEELAATHYRLGLITEELESPQASLKSYETARSMLTIQLQKHPTSTARQKLLSNTLNAMGRAQTRLGDLDKAEALFKESRQIRAGLVGATTELAERTEFERLLANTGMNLALIEKQRGNLDDALTLMTQAQQERQLSLKQEPKNRKLRRDLAKGDYNLANLAIDRDEPSAAATVEKHARQAIERFEELLKEQPDDLDDRHQLALCYQLLADTESALIVTEPDRRIPAIDHYRQARTALERLVARNPGIPRYQFELAQLLGNLAELELDQKQIEAALKLLDRAEELVSALLKDQPARPEYVELQKKLDKLRQQ